MALDNELVDQKLSTFADGIQKRIQESKSNEERLEELELLKEFVYKAPKQAVAIVKFILAHPLPTQSKYWGDVELPGKEQGEVVMQALDLLNELRYIDSDEILPILAELASGDKATYKSKALDILKHFARYDFNVLTKSQIGYGAQRKALDFILKWSLEERMHQLDFVEVVAKCILESSVEGTTATAVDTLTFHFTVVQPTDFLKRMRQEVIEVLFDLYRLSDADSQKIRILNILENATRGPNNAAYGDDVTQMLLDAHKQLGSFYRQVIFDEKGQVKSLAIAEEIETRLYWLNRNGAYATEESKQLRKDILADRLYTVFRTFVGDDFTHRDDAEFQRADAIEKYFVAVTDETVKKWIADLTTMAAQLDSIQEWKFMQFKNFLRKLAADKSEIAKKIFDDSYDRNTNLKKFSASFLDGFRDKNHMKLWDDAVSRIIATKDPVLVSAIPFSLNYDREVDLQAEVRDEDLKLLEEITHQKGQFVFLKDFTDRNHVLHYALINALFRNYRRDPNLIEQLIVEELAHPEYTNIYAQALMLAVLKNWTDFSEFSPAGKEKLKEWLIALPDIDWHTQEVLVNLGKNDLKIILDIFWGRIEHEIQYKETHKSIIDRVHYDAVPYHMNEQLVKRIGEDPQYLQLLSSWLNNLTSDWSLYNWNIGEFLTRIGTSTRAVIMSLIEKDDHESLAKASHLISRMDGNNDFDLCMEIVKRTDNKKILSTIESTLYSTGVVSGEYGIANAYHSKAQTLEGYLNNENERVRKFAQKLRRHMLQSAERERKNADEGKQLRKKEFEG